MSEFEFEARSIITEEEYLKLFKEYSSLYPNHKITVQKNIYFDTPDRVISRTGSVLRVRIYQDNRPTKLTYKIKNIAPKGDEEITQRLSPSEEIGLLRSKIFPIGLVKDALQAENTSTFGMVFFGEIETKRFEVFINKDIIVLDKNIYHGVIDYNIEIESTSKENADRLLKEIANKYSIKLKLDGPSKSARTINRFLKEKEK